MAFSYSNILKTKNRESGVSDHIFWAPVNSFDVNGIKCPINPADATTNADLVTVNDTHTFLTDYGFLRVNGAPSKNSLEANFTGDAGSLKVMKQLKVFIPGSDADLHAAVALVQNEPLIVLVKDSNCPDDQYYQLGCDCVGAYIVGGSFKSGTNKEGAKGWELTIEYPSNAVLIYKGAITFPSVDTGNPVP